MIQTFKLTLVTLVIALGAVFMLSTISGGYVEAQGTITDGLDKGAHQTDPTATVEAEDAVDRIITTVINIFSLVVGVISVIMIIIGGLKYITSAGDAGNVTGAKNTILYAIIGLVVVALAQIIVRFVIGRVTGGVEGTL